MQPAVFLLLGYPGTGKYTVAQTLAARIAELGGTAKVIFTNYIHAEEFAEDPAAAARLQLLAHYRAT